MLLLDITFLCLVGTASAAVAQRSNHAVVTINTASSTQPASLPHSPSFMSFSIEPAFWWEFFGNTTDPNNLTLGAFSTLTAHGARPIIRPGGITEDSMYFQANATTGVQRIQSPTGGIYGTIIGPEYYNSWSLLPEGTKFVSTLNFGNNSLALALDLARASVKYQADKIAFFELGNEPNNYPSSRWSNSNVKYIAQWQNWTSSIDAAITSALNTYHPTISLPNPHWWAPSATTDNTTIHLLPSSIIPLNINSHNQIATYTIHTYQFATCDPTRAALATIPNLLNHTLLTQYINTWILPSALSAHAAGTPWAVGEFNSIACSGKPNVSDTFAQALWTLDSALLYASRNASGIWLHQGATLTFQSGSQTNTAGANGTPGFSTYDILYPRDSPLRGASRVLPGFVGTVVVAEVFAEEGVTIREVDGLEGVDSAGLAVYVTELEGKVRKVVVVNLVPYYEGGNGSATVDVRVVKEEGASGGWGNWGGWEDVTVKRLTAPSVNTTDSSLVTWAGQSFKQGSASGNEVIEKPNWDGTVTIRGSEAVIIDYTGQTS